MAVQMTDNLHQSIEPEIRHDKATVVGLYGIPGSGKTFLLRQLKQKLGQEPFEFYEGSEMISTLVPGGLDAFKKLDKQEKTNWRQLAIDTIRKQCLESGKVAVVTGHFMFLSEGEEPNHSVWTKKDPEAFTHILYLNVPAEQIARRRLDDSERARPSASVAHLSRWQEAEKTQLRSLCRSHSILFSLVSPDPMLPNRVSTLLRDFRRHSEKYNLSCAERRLDDIVEVVQGRWEKALVFDADRTLAAEDTGSLFWKMISKDKDCPLKILFGGPLGYSYTAFRQGTLLYEESANDQEFEKLCKAIASKVGMYPELVSLMREAAEKEYVGVVVVTSGLRKVWEKVLEKEGLSEKVALIGGGRIADGFVVTAAVKAALVARLQDNYNMYVSAFGDSPLDLDMLRVADQAIVVVGEEQSRSNVMDAALTNAIDNGLRAMQVLLPCNVPPRLDTTRLPLIQVTDQLFVNSALCRHNRVLHATGRNAAMLLMTPMRDARLAGAVLREAHRRVGWYLATEFLSELVGIEEYSIPHVQGHDTSGYRLLHEKQTTIVALMRGGEPMAFGVSDALPLAMFVHASHANDIMRHHLREQHTVLLVDSVVNTGETVVQFVQHIRSLHATIRIVVVAGVVQARAVSEDNLSQELNRRAKLHVITLRLSDNRFTGTGTTDTGNRLFNTTHLLRQ